jgi:transcriptional regulator GlxA family with amidase domain
LSKQRAARNLNEERIRAMRHWILSNLSLNLTLEALMKKASMSVRHFSRTFQHEIGTTPADFVEIERVKAALHLIKESDLLLREVAARCGFSGTDIMRRAFLRRTGIIPSNYPKISGKQSQGRKASKKPDSDIA